MPNINEISDERKGRCGARVLKRDTYRRTGRGRNGFEMHYRKEQCKRSAKVDGLCLQHKQSGAMVLYDANGYPC